MDNNLENIYNELLKNVTEKKLKEISVDIINRYRAKDINSLLRYADVLEFDASGMNINRLFARVIQNYHPDKTVSILGRIEESFSSNSAEELKRLKKIYTFSRIKTSIISSRYDIDNDETYAYSDDYFGHDEKYAARDDIGNEFESDYDDVFEDDTDSPEYGFIDALNRMVFGGLDDSLTTDDLHNIEGELDLSDSEIIELTGVEHCRNVTILNLSGNHIYKIDRLAGLDMLELLYLSGNSIESIDCLENLHNLKELDISFNSIEDISVLLKLDELQYVNLLENPVKNRYIIKELEERGVIVIY